MPAAAAQRTPAQVEAARRNGARSRGPATPEGKARSRMNALRHGLASAGDLLLEGEDREAYEELLGNLVDELAPATELEGQLVRRLASALWRQHRADRLEARLFAWTDTPKVFHRGKYLPVDPEAAFDLARFAAIGRYQAQLGREVSRLLRELRLARAELPAATPAAPNEPEPAAAAATSGPVPANANLPNEPEAVAGPPAGPEPDSRNEPGPVPVRAASGPARPASARTPAAWAPPPPPRPTPPAPATSERKAGPG